MSLRSAQSITIEFITSSPTTQAATTADSLPVGTLVVNGTDNGASVTVTNVDTGRYKASFTLPTLAVGDIVELSIAATVGAIAGKAIVWRDTKDVVIDSAGLVDANAVKVGPTGTGTAQTARDLGASVLLSVGTGTGQVNVAVGKVPATLASTDVTGNVAVDLQTIKTQAVTCGAGVAVGAFVGNATAALSVDVSGRVDLGKILGTASAGAVGYVGIDWGHVNAPTTTVALTGTTISTSQVVASVSGAVGSVTGAVGSVTGAVGSVTGAVGSVTGSVGSVASGGIITATFAAGTIIPRCTLVDTLTTYTGNTPQTGDSFARIGALGAGLTALAPSTTALSTVQWTNIRAGYLDNLSAGPVVLAGSAPSWYTSPVDVSANVSAIKVKTDQLTFTLPNKVDASASVTDKTGFKLASDGVDAVVIESGLNLRQATSIIASSSAGVLAGASTTTVTIAAAGVPATPRISATVTADGNRTAVSLTPPT